MFFERPFERTALLVSLALSVLLAACNVGDCRRGAGFAGLIPARRDDVLFNG